MACFGYVKLLIVLLSSQCSILLKILKIAGSFFLFLFGKPPSSRATIYGQARFMTKAEMRKFLNPRNTGLVFGKHRLSKDQSYRNLCLIAPTGAGKTTRFVIPNILQADGSIVVTDPKGSIYKATSTAMKAKGYQIQVVQPHLPDQSERFNPVTRCATPQALRRLAGILAANASSEQGDPFWKVTAQNVINICLSALSNVQDRRLMHLANVRRLLNTLASEEIKTAEFMRKHLDDAVYEEYKAFIAQDSRVMANVLSGARAALDLWADESIVRVTHADTLKIEDLRTKKTIIYIIVPQYQITYYSQLIGMIYQDCFEFVLKTGQDQSISEEERSRMLSVWFFCDEFGNLSKLERLATTTTTLRESRASLSLILQDPSQLEAIYGPRESQAILAGGIQNKLFMSGLDIEVCERIERILGQKTVFDSTDGTADKHARTVAKPLMSTDEIRMLDTDSAILLSGRERPIKLKMLPFYADPRLKALTDQPPCPMGFDYSQERVSYLNLSETA